MAKHLISPQQTIKLGHLYVELTKVHHLATVALRTDPPGQILDDQTMARFIKEENKARVIIGRIRDIQGV
jgi:hypothetical protein